MPTCAEITAELLADLKIKPTDLAKLAEVSPQAVNQWMSGFTKRIGPEAAFTLQRKTGWSAEYLQLGTGPKKLKSDEGIIKEVTDLVSVMEPAAQYKAKKMLEILADDPEPATPDQVDNSKKRA